MLGCLCMLRSEGALRKGEMKHWPPASKRNMYVHRRVFEGCYILLALAGVGARICISFD